MCVITFQLNGNHTAVSVLGQRLSYYFWARDIWAKDVWARDIWAKDFWAKDILANIFLQFF